MLSAETKAEVDNTYRDPEAETFIILDQSQKPNLIIV